MMQNRNCCLVRYLMKYYKQSNEPKVYTINNKPTDNTQGKFAHLNQLAVDVTTREIIMKNVPNATLFSTYEPFEELDETWNALVDIYEPETLPVASKEQMMKKVTQLIRTSVRDVGHEAALDPQISIGNTGSTCA